MRKIHILLLSTVLFITSCEDALDKEPLDIISDAAVWSDPALIDSYLLGKQNTVLQDLEMDFTSGFQ